MEKDRKPRRSRRNLYAQALSEAEQLLLSEAQEIEGLDEEIALLRVKLRQALQEDPQDKEFLLKGLGMLVRAVATKYRLSPKAQDDLYQNILGVVKGIGGALLPEAFSGEDKGGV